MSIVDSDTPPKDFTPVSVTVKSSISRRLSPDRRSPPRSTRTKRSLTPPPKPEQKTKDAGFFQKGVFGGIYVPPFKLAKLMKECEDKSSEQYQRLTWDALRKSLNGIVNKVNASNIREMLPELFSEVEFCWSSCFDVCCRT